MAIDDHAVDATQSACCAQAAPRQAGFVTFGLREFPLDAQRDSGWERTAIDAARAPTGVETSSTGTPSTTRIKLTNL